MTDDVGQGQERFDGRADGTKEQVPQPKFRVSLLSADLAAGEQCQTVSSRLCFLQPIRLLRWGCETLGAFPNTKGTPSHRDAWARGAGGAQSAPIRATYLLKVCQVGTYSSSTVPANKMPTHTRYRIILRAILTSISIVEGPRGRGAPRPAHRPPTPTSGLPGGAALGVPTNIKSVLFSVVSHCVPPRRCNPTSFCPGIAISSFPPVSRPSICPRDFLDIKKHAGGKVSEGDSPGNTYHIFLPWFTQGCLTKSSTTFPTAGIILCGAVGSWSPLTAPRDHGKALKRILAS